MKFHCISYSHSSVYEPLFTAVLYICFGGVLGIFLRNERAFELGRWPLLLSQALFLLYRQAFLLYRQAFLLYRQAIIRLSRNACTMEQTKFTESSSCYVLVSLWMHPAVPASPAPLIRLFAFTFMSVLPFAISRGVSWWGGSREEKQKHTQPNGCTPETFPCLACARTQQKRSRVAHGCCAQSCCLRCAAACEP